MAVDRVLHVTMAPERGGAEAVMETIAAELDRSRYSATLAVPRGSALAASWRAAGWSVIETSVVPRLRDLHRGWALVRELENVVRTRDIQIVHTHGIAAQVYGGRAAARAGRPVLWHVHDTFHTHWTADGLLQRAAAAQRHDLVIAISRTVADSLKGRVPEGQLVTIPNGVCGDRVTPVTRSSTGPLVVWCGRLQRWKGTHLFLDAAAVVRRSHPAARFAIVGGTLFGMERDYPIELRRHASHLQLDAVLEWTGHIPDARPWLAAADVCVHSSVTPEPFGLVVAEAMMQARPVVAFRQGGPAEIVRDGETGLLVPPGDAAAMGQAIGALLADPDHAARLGADGRARALTHFGSTAMVRSVESAYDRARA